MRLARRGTPARVLDILETDGGVLSVEAIMFEMAARFGSVPEKATVERALYRLQESGRVEAVQSERRVDHVPRARSGSGWSWDVDVLGFQVRVRNEWRAVGESE